MKKEIIIFLFICPIVFVYVFSNHMNKTHLALRHKITMQDSFEKLMGKDTPDWNYIQTVRDVQDLDFYKTIYKKNYHFQFDSNPIFRIPKTIHVIWLGPHPFPRESVENMRTWMSHHPDWTFYFWTDRDRLPPCKDMKVHKVQNFSFKFLEKYYEESHNWGEKSDLLRYEILYQLGGLYVDHDATCQRPFHGLHTGYDFYAALEMPHEEIEGHALTAGIGVIGAKSYHPAIRGAIQMITDRWEAVTKKYKGTGSYIQARVVTLRTYIALTLALKKTLNLPGNRDIIFPASYFYPKHGMLGFYSLHLYGTKWNDTLGNPVEEDLVKKLRNLRTRDNKILRIELFSFLAIMGCFILYFLINRILKKHSVNV